MPPETITFEGVGLGVGTTLSRRGAEYVTTDNRFLGFEGSQMRARYTARLKSQEDRSPGEIVRDTSGDVSIGGEKVFDANEHADTAEGQDRASSEFTRSMRSDGIGGGSGGSMVALVAVVLVIIGVVLS